MLIYITAFLDNGKYSLAAADQKLETMFFNICNIIGNKLCADIYLEYLLRTKAVWYIMLFFYFLFISWCNIYNDVHLFEN